MVAKAAPCTPPVEYKNKYRVKDNVGNTANQHSRHAGLRASVCADNIAEVDADDENRKAQYDYPSIIKSVGHDVWCGAEQGAQRF